ncbi:MAG TPA: sugar phosphate nucleotidyltransferase [Gemmatimonadales bacterium]|jgi:NDP-sugar pyrophosphorylase family protein
MKAVVLAGGQGNRLRPYTFTVPKPLLPLGDRPLLNYIIQQLARCKVNDIILALGYQAELIRAYCGDGSRFGVRIDYVTEEKPLGTAGPLALCRGKLDKGEPFFAMNGDIVTRLDFGRLAQFHTEKKAQLTIGYIQHTWTSQFGVLQLDGDLVTGIVEKPSYVNPVSAGIYCVSPEAAALIPDDAVMTMPQLADRVRAGGGRVAAYKIEEFWRALETRENFEAMLKEEEILPLLEQS